MSTPILISFNGRKRSGKNTAAAVVGKWGEARGLTVVNRGFADLVKLSIARSMGLATNMNDAIVIVDEAKEVGDIIVQIPTLSIQRAMTFREFTKWFATEGHRDVFGEDFWVEKLLPVDDWHSSFISLDGKYADICTISDLRFVNEARRTHELLGEVVEIHRPGLEGDNHASELPLPRGLIDVTIENDSSLEAFEVKVNSWMTSNYHMRFVDVLSE